VKQTIKFIALVVAIVIGAVLFVGELGQTHSMAQTPDEPKIPEVIVLGKDAKLGGVRFAHVKHNGGEYNIDESGPIACISCHHTARPAAEIEKHPPLKTAWPADRETTLTAELFKKDAKNAGVVSCRDCHARVGEKPKLLDAIPEVKHEGSPAMVSLTNQQAYHRACTACHAEVKKTRPDSGAPTAMQCTACHKRGT
jgi:hypothetical protein